MKTAPRYLLTAALAVGLNATLSAILAGSPHEARAAAGPEDALPARFVHHADLDLTGSADIRSPALTGYYFAKSGLTGSLSQMQ